MNKTEPQQWLGRTHFEKCLVGDWGWMVGTLEMSESRKLIVLMSSSPEHDTSTFMEYPV